MSFIWCCFPFPRHWEKIHIFSVFFGLLKNRKHQPSLLFSGLLLKIVICMISHNRGFYSAHVTENWLPRIVRVFQSETTTHALSQHWRAHDGLMWCWHFLRRVWFYCEVNRMNSDKYKKQTNKKTMCFLETDTWLCPLQKQLEKTGKPCVMVSFLVTPLWHGQLLDVTGSGGAMWEPVTV